jgi:hypothetical protein
VFDHVDYMSTVSGGGYLGSSISALMRQRRPTVTEISGRVQVDNVNGERVVTVVYEKPSFWRGVLQRVRGVPQPVESAGTAKREECVYRFADFARLAVDTNDHVSAGQRLLAAGASTQAAHGSFGERLRWRVRPSALLREMSGLVDERGRWVNVSDGGHIENLACFELLRRRCKYIIVGDAEADPEHRFNGLATLIRSARIDLGIHIEISVDELRLNKERLYSEPIEAGSREAELRLDTERHCKAHFAVGRIEYPGRTENEKPETGYLLYMKSSLTGDEDEVIREYRHGAPTFPHESTADQMFNEGQFEAYRSLGEHIAQQALKHLQVHGSQNGRASYADVERWFDAMWEASPKEPAEATNSSGQWPKERAS